MKVRSKIFTPQKSRAKLPLTPAALELCPPSFPSLCSCWPCSQCNQISSEQWWIYTSGNHAFVEIVTEVNKVRNSEFLSFEKCLRYPKLIDNLNLNIKNTNTTTGGQTKDSFSSIQYPALHHISIIARTTDVKKMIKVLKMVKNKATYGDTINPTTSITGIFWASCIFCVFIGCQKFSVQSA